MRAYSIDLRKRIVHAYENEQITQRELAERFQVSLRCVQMLLKRWREEGTVEPKPHGGGQPRKITGEKLERLRRAVEQQPDATLEELRERCALDVSLVCVFRTLEREEFQWKKKTIAYREQLDDEIDRERQEWLHDIEDIPAERFVFLDESNAKTNMTRRYGRALRGERVVDYVPDARYESLTMLSALDHQGRTTCVVYEGGTDIPVMRLFAEEFLAPTLQPGQIVVMDNLSAHHDAGVVAALEATGAEVWFQPRYSPEFNPIEKMWSKVKARLRTIKARAKETLTKAIGEALEAVTPTDAANWFQSCGYTKIQT